MPTLHGDGHVQQAFTVGTLDDGAQGAERPRFSQFLCTHPCDLYIGVVFPFFVVLAFVLPARELDTSCSDTDVVTFDSRENVILHMVAELGQCVSP